MNGDQIDDLKQFITATVSQLEERLGGRIDRVETRLDGVEAKLDCVEARLGSVEQKLEWLEQKVDDGFSGIGEAVELINERQDEMEGKLVAVGQGAA